MTEQQAAEMLKLLVAILEEVTQGSANVGGLRDDMDRVMERLNAR